LCSCNTEASINVTTGKIVLCYAPGAARAEMRQVINLAIEAGAKGLIFATYSSNRLDTLDMCKDSMPCVLVDFEIGKRIASYVQEAG
jgi:DNA-binding LacI/PurR family transcriptional regulator